MRLVKLLQGRKGQALILAYLVLIFLTILVAAFLTKAISENRLAHRQRLTQEATYLAEGGIEDALAKFSQAIANWDVQPDVASYNVTTTYNSFHNAQVNTDIIRLEDTDRIMSIAGGAQAFVRNYKINAAVQHPLENNIAVTLKQVAARWIIPAFQHTVFYEDDLELLPGPNMHFTGRIHCNSDIYLGTHNTLTLDTLYLHSVGDIYNQRKNDDSVMAGTVNIRLTPESPETYAAMAGLDSNNPNWTTESQVRWGGTVQSAVHGVRRLAAPQVHSIQPDGYYANQANLKIANDTVTDTKTGQTLRNGIEMPPGTVTSSTSFYNNREAKTILMTEIDLQKLAGADGGYAGFSNHLPSNGLIYATRDDAGAIYQPGIRLVNGEEIDRSGGLTVVTNDPLYIQGDYNTEGKKPCAVICDSVNLLSAGWDNDADSRAGLNKRGARATIYNIGFIAGIDETDPSVNKYNGGLENYPRLHENWSAKTLSIRGAFLALWYSQIAQGSWLYGDPQYEAPIRDWDYDSDFNDPSKLPPFTPWAVEMRRVAWWKE